MKDKGGPLAWAGLATYVALYDYIAIKNGKETMSAAFGRALKNPYTRPLTLLVVFGILKHLLAPNVLPEADPLHYIADKWRSGVE